MNSVAPTLPPPAGPASAVDWERFLKPLIFAVPNPPSEMDFRTRASAVAYALPHVPASMLTEWRRREAVARFKFFPSPAEIAEWLEPDLRERTRTEALLALQAPKPEPRAERTPEEIAAVRAKAAAFAAEMNHERDVQRVNAKPAYLTGEHLAEARRIAARRLSA